MVRYYLLFPQHVFTVDNWAMKACRLIFDLTNFGSHEHIEVLVGAGGDYLFFRHREGPWVPTLRLLHKCKKLIIKWFLFNCWIKKSKSLINRSLHLTLDASGQRCHKICAVRSQHYVPWIDFTRCQDDSFPQRSYCGNFTNLLINFRLHN